MQSFLKIATLLATAVFFGPGNCSPRGRQSVTLGVPPAITAEPCRVVDVPTPSCLPGNPKLFITTIVRNAQHRPETVWIFPGGITWTIPNVLPAKPNAPSVTPSSGKPSLITRPTSTRPPVSTPKFSPQFSVTTLPHSKATFSTVTIQA